MFDNCHLFCYDGSNRGGGYMLIDKKNAENKLEIYLASIEDKKYQSTSNSVKLRQKWYMDLSKRYNIPIGVSSDIISRRKDLSEYNEFVLFAITDVIKEEWVSRFFTDKEIKLYKDKKYITETVTFPIEISMLQVTEDQYIGVSSAKWLMTLRDSYLINYNADTQRALEIMLKGDTVIYRPFINERSVSEIADDYKNGSFIPNTISLNINLDDEKADYYFKDNKLVINNITEFDIFDGYHRYLGMARNYDADHSFDYPIELRITMFSVAKAKQFIWQEDHKTKMVKVDANSYDQSDVGNQVVSRLNNDPEFLLNGMLTIRGGYIHAGIFNQLVKRLYFNKRPTKKDVINVSKLLKQQLNSFMEDYNEYLEREWLIYEIYIILYGLSKNIDNDNIYKAIHNITPEQIKKLKLQADIRKGAIDVVEEVYGYERV